MGVSKEGLSRIARSIEQARKELEDAASVWKLEVQYCKHYRGGGGTMRCMTGWRLDPYCHPANCPILKEK